jgi:hypothetical protein
MITTQIHFLNAENKKPPQTETVQRKPVELIPSPIPPKTAETRSRSTNKNKPPLQSVASYSVSHLRCDWRHLKLPPNLSGQQLWNQKVVGLPVLEPIWVKNLLKRLGLFRQRL